MNATEELQQEVMRKKRPLHKEEGGDRAQEQELFGDRESEAEVKVYLTKTGTKVHLLKCHVLHNADTSKMKMLAICKHCMKTRKEQRLFHTD